MDEKFFAQCDRAADGDQPLRRRSPRPVVSMKRSRSSRSTRECMEEGPDEEGTIFIFKLEFYPPVEEFVKKSEFRTGVEEAFRMNHGN